MRARDGGGGGGGAGWGPGPHGHPAGMVALASHLRSKAHSITGPGNDVGAALDGVSAEGNFIDRYRSDAVDVRNRAGNAGGQLIAAAEILESAAPDVAADNERARRAAERAAEERRAATR